MDLSCKQRLIMLIFSLFFTQNIDFGYTIYVRPALLRYYQVLMIYSRENKKKDILGIY